MPSRLPRGITLGDLSESFKLELVSLSGAGSEPQPAQEEVYAFPVHILRLDRKEHVLPFPGGELVFTEQDSLLEVELGFPTPAAAAVVVTPNATPAATATAATVVAKKVRVLFARPKSPWAGFCLAVEDWLTREEGHILTACETYFSSLSQDPSYRYGRSVVPALKEILDCGVFLADNRQEVLEWAGGNGLPERPLPFVAPPVDSVNSALVSSVDVPVFPGFWQEEEGWDSPLSLCPLFGEQGLLGYLGLGVSESAFGSVERYFVGKTGPLVALELLKNQCVRDSERQHHRDFLFDLLYNNFDSLEVICSRGKLWGWDFSKPHVIAVAEAEGFSALPAERQRLAGLISQVSHSLSNFRPGSICLERNDQPVFLFPLKESIAQSQAASAAEEFLKPVWKAAERFFPGRKIYVGVGSLYPTAREIPRSFQEARAALELGRLLFPDKRLTTFAELGIMRLLQKLDHQELEDFRQETVGSLLAFDREGNLDLEQTLLTYFLCSGDLNLAAQKLFLHPNTLRYRLKKAAEVLDKDIFRLDNQVSLFIGLQIGRLKALWSE
ncbi:purine catabolism regulatory protein [Peptococcaceae bacterium CEB3]|nr:purine catabolism regulatory protein [Peptococcaceae bacterium CEB3]